MILKLFSATLAAAPSPRASRSSEANPDRLMSSALAYSTATRQSETALGPWFGRWYFVAMALAMIVVAVAGFAPSIIDPSRRLAPLTPLVVAHGILVLCWLLLFVFQVVLIRSPHVAFHRRMGIVALVLLAVLVPLSYVVTVHMVHHGFDLSGDQSGDLLFGSIFNFATLIEFLVLAGIALVHRAENVSCWPGAGVATLRPFRGAGTCCNVQS